MSYRRATLVTALAMLAWSATSWTALAGASSAASSTPATAGMDAWALVDKGATIAAAVEASPLYVRVQTRQLKAEPLLDEDITGSLDAVRAYGPALDSLDAAVSVAKCTLPKNLDAPNVLKLADAALITALADGADKKPARAVADVERAADLATLIARCGKPTLLSGTLAIAIGEHARPIAWFLAEQRLVDDKGLARIAQVLASSATPAVLERAVDGERALLGRSLTLAEQKVVDDVGRRLDAAAKDQSALTAAAADFEHIVRPVHNVIIKCDEVQKKPAGDPRIDPLFTVTREVAHVLERRGANLLSGDSVVGPSLDGRGGVVVVNAGPIARSCGFESGDLVVDVNGVSTARMDQALVEAPKKMARDGYGVFRVMRRGAALTWRVDVEKPPALPASPSP